jgi:hypothetical protein
MFPLAEPAGDIRAQLRAMLDDSHPKRAVFVVPEDYERALIMRGLPVGLFVPRRPRGTLFTRSDKLATAFLCAPEDEAGFDRIMARILDYPEAKPDVVRACQGRPVSLARAVQAHDADGWVVTEAFASPAGLQKTSEALQKHVPPGGSLRVMTPIDAVGRRLLLREAGN